MLWHSLLVNTATKRIFTPIRTVCFAYWGCSFVVWHLLTDSRKSETIAAALRRLKNAVPEFDPIWNVDFDRASTSEISSDTTTPSDMTLRNGSLVCQGLVLSDLCFCICVAISAIKIVYPRATIFLCDFHIYKVNYESTSNRKRCFYGGQLFRRIGRKPSVNASTMTICGRYWYKWYRLH